MKYFLDTEFIEDGKTIDVISLGIACEDGRTLYLQNAECNFKSASDWVWRHVFPHLAHFNMAGQRSCDMRKVSMDSGLGYRSITSCRDRKEKTLDPCPWATRLEIRDQVLAFCIGENPEFWGYYADYDWVVFCQLFGRMIDLPKGFPMYCRDIKQLSEDKTKPTLPEQEDETHHALVDAFWNKEAYEVLTKGRS